MTPKQERKKEKIVKAMKKNFSDFRQRYGSDAKSVMYATATKQAMNEDGHSDVASARRKVSLIMEDASQMSDKLNQMDPMESLPSWWMNKMAVASSHLDSLRNYLLVPSSSDEEVNEETLDELDRKTLGSYITKASDARGHRGLPTRKVDNRYSGVYKASKRINKMEKDSMKKMNESDHHSDTEHDYYSDKLDRAGKKLGIDTSKKISDEDSHKLASEHEQHVQKTGDHLYQGGVSMGYKHPKGHEYEAMSNHIENHNKYHKEDRFPGPVSPDEKHFSDKEGFNANRKMMKMMSDIRKRKDAKQVGTRKEELSGNQHKIDANKNGRIDAHDFKLLRQRKK